MTLKQKRFADEYIISGNASASALKAGYSKKYINTSAFKLLQNATIKKYIDKRLKKLDDEKTMEVKEALERLTATARRETYKTIIKRSIVQPDGSHAVTEMTEWTHPTIQEATKAQELLLKINGAFNDTISLKADVVLISDDID